MNKIKGSYLLAALFWLNSLVLMWLMILDKVQRDFLSATFLVIFMVAAVLSSAVAGSAGKKKDGR